METTYNKSPKNLAWRIVLAVAVLLLIATVCFLSMSLHRVNVKLVNTNAQLIATQQQLKTVQDNFTTETALESRDLISRVGQLMTLPASEQPTIATVADLSKLQGQTFYMNAAVGDKVIIYSSANKVILFRPSTNKIINSGPLSSISK